YGPRHTTPALPFLSLGLAALWDSWRGSWRALLVAGWLAGAGLTLVAVSTTPQPRASYKSPVSELLWPAFREGDLSLNHQSFTQRTDSSERASWNLGERVGLHGHASLFPLGLVWGASVAVYLWAARSCRAGVSTAAS